VDWNRAAGFFSRHRSTMRASAGGIGRSVVLRSGGSDFRMAVIVSAPVSPRNARCPVSISGVLDGFTGGERRRLLALAQRVAVEQFRYQIGHAVLLADVVHGKDVGMVQRCGGASFLFETAQALGIRPKFHRQDFDRDVTRQPHVARAIDLSHAARAERCNDFIRSETNAWLKWHLR
jgi:hypothetical protein